MLEVSRTQCHLKHKVEMLDLGRKFDVNLSRNLHSVVQNTNKNDSSKFIENNFCFIVSSYTLRPRH